MKKISRFSIVALATIIATTGISLAVANELKGVFTSKYGIAIDGTEVDLPSSLPVLNYQNSTYVPLRFIGENLGTEVDFDKENGVILIDADNADTKALEEKIKKLEEENKALKEAFEEIKQSMYKRLTVTVEDNYGMNFGLTLIRESVDSAVFSISLDNKNNLRTLQIDPYNTVLEINGKEYTNVEITSGDLNSTVAPMSKKTGRLEFFGIEDSIEKGSLTFSYKVNNNEDREITLYFENVKE